MSSSNSSSAQAIYDIKQQMAIFSQVMSIVFIVFGGIGHAFNIYIFTRPKFRYNPCVRYFLASAFSGYAVVLITMPLRMLQFGFNIDIFSYSAAACKILSYILACCRVLSSWFIALASIDRFLCSSSSNKFRGWSNLRVASHAIFVTLGCICLSYIHLLFYQTIVLLSQTCSLVSSTYQTFYALFNLIVWSWIPTLCMLICGLLIIRNIRQGKRRVAVQNYYQRNQSKTDRQLMQMLLIQSFVMGSTTTALAIAALYVSIMNTYTVRSDLDRARDLYLSTPLNYIASIGSCMSFYIFTLSSQLFRNELKNCLYRRQPAAVISNIDMNRRSTA